MMSILQLYRQQGWQVEFVTPAQETEQMIDLASEGISSQSIELNSDSFDAYIVQYQPDIVTDDITEFVEAAVTLYTDEEVWSKAQEKGTALLHAHYLRFSDRGIGI